MSISRFFIVAVSFGFVLTETIEDARRSCLEQMDMGSTTMFLECLGAIENKFGNLDSDNELPSLYNYKGVALYESNRLAEAGQAFNLAVKLHPSDLRAWINLAEIRQLVPTVGSFNEAIDAIEQLSGWKCLARSFTDVEWRELELHVRSQEETLTACVSSQSSEVCQKSLISGVTFTGLNGTTIRDLFKLLFSDNDAQTSVNSQADSEYTTGLTGQRVASASGAGGRPLSVGIILSQVDGGPVSALSQDLFWRMSGPSVRVTCFLMVSSNTLPFAWQTAMLHSFGAEGVMSLEGLDSVSAAAVIAQRGVDVLVDMNGLNLHTGLHIMSHRPAPVQLSYLGDPYTSGVAHMDYFLSDAVATPPDVTADHFTEKLMLLPACYLANSHAQWLPDVLRRDRHEKRALMTQVLNGAVYTADDSPYRHVADPLLLGAFHGFVKIDPTALHVWSNILRRCGASDSCYLVLNNNRKEGAISNLQRQAEYRGVAAHRLLFLDQSGWEEHVQRKSAVDLFLDTFIKNGHTTTVDAAYAGLPIVALAGQSSAHQRSTESVVRHSGGGGWEAGLAFSTKEYEDLATMAATDRARLRAWRRRVHRMRRAGPLFDTQNLADAITPLMRAAVELRRLEGERASGDGGGAPGKREGGRFHIFASGVDYNS